MVRIYHPEKAGYYVHFDAYLGCDLGKSMDYSAICLIEELVWVKREWWQGAIRGGVRAGEDPLMGWASIDKFNKRQLEDARTAALTYGRPPNPPLRVAELFRYPLHAPYQGVVDDVARTIQSGPLKHYDVAVLVDKGNVGPAVLEMFNQAGLRVIPILIHGGYRMHVDRSDMTHHVPKRDLVGAAQVALQNGRLEIPGALPHRSVVTDELKAFKGSISESGHDRYEAREREHDDLVLALSMAVWYREYRNSAIERQMAQASFARS